MIIPDGISKAESIGERIVFHKFKHEKNNLIVLHSVFLHNHVKNVSGEIDFLVLAPNRGIFCLEIKHGSVKRTNGKWFYNNRFSNKGPFRQASDAMYSLRKWILQNSTGERKKRLEKILFGTGIIFSGITTRIELGSEGEQWQVLYRDALINNEIFIYIDALSKEWHKKHKSQYWYDPNLSRPSTEDCEYLLKLIRNDFNREYTTLNSLLDTETTIQSFTEEQLKILDHTLYNDRCLIEGYAGTGKTVLALELFKTHLEGELRVGFFCYNRRLANTIKKQVESVYSSNLLSESFVGSFHSYLMGATGLKTPIEERDKFFNYTLQIEFLLANEENNKVDLFDIIILDEAQDLITENNLMVIDNILLGGLEKGKWVFFGDFLYQNLYNEKINFIELLKEYAYFTRLSPLTVNCRNTKRISEQNRLVTGVSYNDDNPIQVDGVKPELKFVNTYDEASTIAGIIKDYLEENVPMSQMVLLSPYKYENTPIRENQYLNQLIENKKIEYSTIYSFKGLEKNIVIIFGINELNNKTLNLLYTGISRARVRLHLLLNNGLKEEYQSLIIKNLK